MKNKLLISVLFIVLLNNISYSQNNNFGIPENNSNKEDFNLRLNFELGYGNWNKTIPNGTQDFIADYYHGLKDGFDIESSAIYFLKNKIGLGLTANRFDSHAALDNVGLIDENDSVIARGNLIDKIKITFVGVSLCYYFEIRNNKDILQFELSPGYIFYNHSRKWIIYNDNIYGKTFGLDFGICYDFKISSRFGIGLGYNILTGNLDEVEVNSVSQKLSQSESLIRTNFTLALNIYL